MRVLQQSGIWAYLNCFSWHSAKNVHMGVQRHYIFSKIMEEMSAGIFEVFLIHAQN
jgi:hypothetical protein